MSGLQADLRGCTRCAQATRRPRQASPPGPLPQQAALFCSGHSRQSHSFSFPLRYDLYWSWGSSGSSSDTNSFSYNLR
eukprot:3120731-Rhodomonas_salina.1